MAMSAQEINARGSGEMHEQASSMRRALIRDSFQVLVQQLELQEHQQDLVAASQYPEGATLDYTVLEENMHIPGNAGSTTLLTYLLKPVVEQVGDAPARESLRVLLPAPDDFMLNEFLDPSLLVEPDYVVIQHTNNDEVESWFKVSERSIEPFSVDTVTDVPLSPNDMIDDDIALELIVRGVTLRVDSGLPTASWLREQFINMNVVTQRILTFGEEKQTDVQ